MRTPLLAGLILVSSLAVACKGNSTTTSAPSASASASAAPASSAKGEIPAPPDVAAPPADAQKTSSGLAFKILQPGTGTVHPEPQDAVKARYTGWTTDGKMFDTSTRSSQLRPMSLKQVIPGWTEGLQLMVSGEKRRFWIPQELAYQGKPGRPAGMLVFDIELVDIVPGPKPVPAPPDVAAPPKDATKTTSGLFTKVLEKAKETKHPKDTDKVKINYTGWTTDGKMFDTTTTRGRPVVVQMGSGMAGWTEALKLMSPGEKRRLWIPEELANKGKPGGPPGMLVFDMELVDVVETPKVPADVKAPPATAQKTPSGLASTVLKAGTGQTHPKPTSRVEVNYTGWTTDGKMFDSTSNRGEPSAFALNQVIPGWTEGLQLMVEGEKRRLWIPEQLAYKGRPGKPQGMLVFDVELLKIVSP